HFLHSVHSCEPSELFALDISARAFGLALVALEVIVKNFKINQYWVRCIPGGDRRRDRRWGGGGSLPPSMFIPTPPNPIAISLLQLGPNSAIPIPHWDPYRNITSPTGAPISMTGSLQLVGGYQLWGQLY